MADEGDARGSKVLIHSVSQPQQNGSIEQSEFIPNDQLEESSEESSFAQDTSEDSIDE